MYEEDFIMRQIREITAVIAKVVFGKKADSMTLMLHQRERQKVEYLADKVKDGEIQDAVEELDRLADNNTKENLMIGLEFYAQLSDMDEEYFINSGYSFGKMRDDFKRFAKKFGMEQMTELYFGKDDEENTGE
ncbi:DUF6483 family protein [Ruminococcus flavefaciens]|uniref:DUF6483 family protein n=1 Tax=Ruminococcus flavefaciens TaxID=1265 RepID=UPI0004919B45|nr:DUF6483 family protein [Ruminococcus flavefaciens]